MFAQCEHAARCVQEDVYLTGKKANARAVGALHASGSVSSFKWGDTAALPGGAGGHSAPTTPSVTPRMLSASTPLASGGIPDLGVTPVGASQDLFVSPHGRPFSPSVSLGDLSATIEKGVLASRGFGGASAALGARSGRLGAGGLVAVTRGRPDMRRTFKDAHAAARLAGDCRVAVLVCGNQGILDGCMRMAADWSHDDVTFECHYEAFGF
jgi:hypothetical protein